MSRRQLSLLLSSLSATTAFSLSPFLSPSPSLADEGTGDFRLFENTKELYSFLVPQDWEMGEGVLGTRKLVAFHPPEDLQTNVSILITPLSADFTSLGSFGTADNFGETLVNGMDRSWQKNPGQAAKLITTKSVNGKYFVEYTLQKPGEPKLHMLSIVGVGVNVWYNQLFTLTAQFLEEDSAKFKGPLEKVVSSFKILT